MENTNYINLKYSYTTGQTCRDYSDINMVQILYVPSNTYQKVHLNLNLIAFFKVMIPGLLKFYVSMIKPEKKNIS